MMRVSSRLLILGLIAAVVLTGTAAAVSNAEYDHLKLKIVSGENLSRAEINGICELHDAGTPLVDNWTLNQLKEFGRIGDRPIPVRPPHNSLDVYLWSEIAAEWIDIVGVGTDCGIVDDDHNAGPFDIGFSFPFFDNSYSSIRVCSNGWASFTSSSTAYFEGSVPSADEPNNALYPFWDDMYPPSGEYQILYYDDTANNRFILSWINIAHINSATARYSYQLVLYPSGAIHYNYNFVSTEAPANTSCTVGIENATGTEAVQICFDGTGWLPTSGTSIMISQPDGVPSPVTNLAGSAEGTNVTVTWDDPTEDTNGNPITIGSVEVWLGQAVTGILLGTVAAGVETYMHTGAPDGFVGYAVRPYLNPYYGSSRNVTVLVGDQTDYSSDFETSNGNWISSSGWEWGTPAGIDAPTPHSGNNVWGTMLNGQYAVNACYQLDLNLGQAIADGDAEVDFWAWWDIEGSFTRWDGCNFKISVDEGATWDVVTPTEGYTDGLVSTDNPCIPEEACWSDYIRTWTQIQIPIGQYAGFVPIFRFEFGSDPIITALGFYLDDLTITGLGVPAYADLSGTITLDGGAGSVQNVVVRSDGFGAPETNPAVDGTYSLDNVLVGNRTIRGFLDGYDVAVTTVAVTEAGPNVANLTLRRSIPPTVTGFTGTVNNATGEVSLNWDDSPDALVDNYYIYSRIHGTPAWSHVETATASEIVHTLPTDGIWDLTVTAVDLNVSTPVESEQAALITVLYGALPPNGLSAIGNFDNKIRLNWFEPGNDFGQELVYDDGTAESFITLAPTNGQEDLIAVKFTPPAASEILYPIEISACAIFMQNENEVTSVRLCPKYEWADEPDIWNPLATWENVSAQDSPGWLMIETGGTIILETEAEFWVVLQFPAGQQGPGVGADQSALNNRSYSRATDTWIWIQDFNYDYMMRAWIRGGAGQRAGGDEFMLTAGDAEGYKIESIPSVYSYHSAENEKGKADLKNSKSKSLDLQEKTAEILDKELAAKGSKARLTQVKSNSKYERTPFVRAPELEWRPRESRDRTLDELDYFIVYRDGADVGHPTTTTFDDIDLAENVAHAYQVTSHYDDGSESTPTNTVNQSCNMAPSAPTGLTGTAVGSTQMRLDWTNPTTNEDGTALTDLQSIEIYRDGNLIGTVNSPLTTYTDTPPENDQPYSWTVRATDEVPNISTDSEPFASYVQPPWTEEVFDWYDISQIGNPLALGDDTQILVSLPFAFPFFGETYTEGWVSSNGYFNFIESTFSSTYGPQIPDPSEPNGVIAAFWDDLDPSAGGQIYTYSNAQDGIFVVQFQDVPHWNTGGGPETFEMIIDDHGGILFQYQTVAEAGDCTVGAENADGTVGVSLCYNQDGLYCPESGLAVSLWGRPRGEIRGQVRVFGSNLPLANVSVWSSGFPDTVRTDAGGLYYLEVEPGTHDITIHKQGYCDQTFAGLVVADDQSVVQNASMLWPHAGFSVTSLNLLSSSHHDVSGDFEISNLIAGCPLEFSITVDQEWLSLSLTEGQVPVNGSQLITVVANVADIPDGEYNANLEISHNDVGSPYIIPVNLVVDADENPLKIPTEFAFHQNYPNPFNATTAFGIDLPAESRVELVIFNVMGQVVARPVMANYPAGRHTVLFTAEALPSGMYIARMTAGDFAGLQKIVLLK